MTPGNRDHPEKKDDPTDGNDVVTGPTEQLSATQQGRRTFMKAIGAAATAPLFAAAARARGESSGEPTATAASDQDPDQLGGGDGYPRTVAPSEATVVVSTTEELAAAFEDASNGDVVYVAGDATIDVASRELTIPEGVTLASDRGIDGSPGGLIETPVMGQWPGVLTATDDVRITGLRLAGPRDEYEEYTKPASSGLVVDGPGCEVDNVEVWGFNHAAIRLDRSAHVHHSFVHSNPMDGLGYGVLCNEGDESVIEHNRFEYNRHSVGNDGSAGYVVRYNHFGPETISYPVGVSRPGGTTLEIHHNTFEATRYIGHDDERGPSVVIGGTPDEGADVHHNWFYNDAEPRDRPEMWTDEAIIQVYTDRWNNVEFSENAFGTDEPPEHVGCPR